MSRNYGGRPRIRPRPVAGGKPQLVGVMVPAEVAAKLEELAASTGQSRSALVRQALDALLESVATPTVDEEVAA